MVDFKIDNENYFQLNQYGFFDTVDEMDEFEQTVHLRITEFMWDSVIGEHDPEIIRQMIELEASRVAQEDPRLDRVSDIRVAQSREEPNTYKVAIHYDSGWVSDFAVN